MKSKSELTNPRLTLLLTMILALLLFSKSPVKASIVVDQNDEATTQNITLEWDPNQEESVTGYLVYYGKSSRNYLTPLDAGLNTTFTVNDLNAKINWFFAVKAYDAQGNQSDYSNEVLKEPLSTPTTTSTTSTAITFSNDDPQEPTTPTTTTNVDPQEPITPTGTSPTISMTSSFTLNPLLLNQNFGEENDSSIRAETLPTTSGSGKIVAGTGPWPSDGGWIKTLTDDYFHDHWTRTGWSYYNDHRGESRVAHGDIDGDGKDEIIVGMGPIATEKIAPYGYFQVLDDNHKHLFWGQVDWEVYNESNGETWPTCGDLDGDGKDEILIGLGQGGMGTIEVFSVVDNQLKHHSWMNSTWSEYNQAMGEVRPSSGDLDGDGKDDVIIGFGPLADNPEIPGGTYEVLSGNGEHMAWGEVGWSDYNQLNGESRPVVGDLNGDGKNEVIIGLGAGSNGAFEIQSLNDDGNLSNQAWLEIPWWQEYNEMSGETRPAVGNLDGDDSDEIVIALGQGGGGWVHLIDDQENGYNHYISLQLWPEEYNLNNGASWVTIQEGTTK